MGSSSQCDCDEPVTRPRRSGPSAREARVGSGADCPSIVDTQARLAGQCGFDSEGKHSVGRSVDRGVSHPVRFSASVRPRRRLTSSSRPSRCGTSAASTPSASGSGITSASSLVHFPTCSCSPWPRCAPRSASTPGARTGSPPATWAPTSNTSWWGQLVTPSHPVDRSHRRRRNRRIEAWHDCDAGPANRHATHGRPGPGPVAAGRPSRSRPRSPSRIEELARSCAIPVTVHHRPAPDRWARGERSSRASAARGARGSW
jgi:hypothetical protein